MLFLEYYIWRTRGSWYLILVWSWSRFSQWYCVWILLHHCYVPICSRWSSNTETHWKTITCQHLHIISTIYLLFFINSACISLEFLCWSHAEFAKWKFFFSLSYTRLNTYSLVLFTIQNDSCLLKFDTFIPKFQ